MDSRFHGNDKLFGIPIQESNKFFGLSTKLPDMRKLFCAGIFLYGLIAISSCDYDDSNDIDIITPNDSTQTGMLLPPEFK